MFLQVRDRFTNDNIGIGVYFLLYRHLFMKAVRQKILTFENKVEGLLEMC